MTELLLVVLRSVGVVLPGAGVLGVVELRGGSDPEDFGAFLGSMALSLLAAAIWSALDARRAPTRRVLPRWVAVVLVVSGGLALATTWLAPGSPPQSARVADTFQTVLFYGVPLLVAAGIGVGAGADLRSGEATGRDTGTGR